MKQRIVLKLSGELFSSTEHLKNVIEQIKKISTKYNIGIVVGAGNIFRGSQGGKELGIKQTTGDAAGMVATIINGLILQNMLENAEIKSKLLSAIPCPTIATSVTSENISYNLDQNKIVIFVGGTGNPFFTTDTNAILRALQMEAKLVLKGTKVNGIFDKDPETNSDAILIKNTTINTVLEKKLDVMDLTAMTLAQNRDIKIRIFNIFDKDSILNVLKDSNFGSTIS